MIIDCIADLHGYYPKLKGGDVLIVAGDLTARDTAEQWEQYFIWQGDLPYKKIIFIGGNHDNRLQNVNMAFYSPAHKVDYLCDSGTEFEGLKIWGSPWTTTFPGINPHCCAFTKNNDMELYEKWNLIPDDTDILITHNPSFGNFDITTRGESVGSLTLWLRILEIMPKLHVCGHVHESYGQAVHYNKIHLVNCSHVNEQYKPVNPPIRIEL